MANEPYYYPTQIVGNGTAPQFGMRQQQFAPTVENNSNTGLMTILVNSEDEVGYYPVAAGLTVMLVSFNLGKFWLKSTGKNGVPVPLREFSFEEKQVQPVDTSYATKEEIKSLNEKLDKLIAELGGTKE